MSSLVHMPMKPWKLLQNPSEQEQANLGPWRYQPNTVTLHTDTTQLPNQRKLWSSWNLPVNPGTRSTPRLRQLLHEPLAEPAN